MHALQPFGQTGNRPEWGRCLQITAPLSMLQRLPLLELADMRGVHAPAESNQTYWDKTKCEAMSHMATLSKLLKKKRPPGKVLLDLD